MAVGVEDGPDDLLADRVEPGGAPVGRGEQDDRVALVEVAEAAAEEARGASGEVGPAGDGGDLGRVGGAGGEPTGGGAPREPAVPVPPGAGQAERLPARLRGGGQAGPRGLAVVPGARVEAGGRRRPGVGPG